MTGLFGSRVLEAALGLACVYLLLAMFCSTVNEWIAALLALRSNMLRRGILRLLGDAAAEFYNHPLISALAADGRHPEHIAPSAFSKAVMDLAAGRQSDAEPARPPLPPFLQTAELRTEDARRAIEQWFDGAMDAASRRYRKAAQARTAVIAAAVTAATNADSLRIAAALLAGNPAACVLGWNAPASGGWAQRLAGWTLTAVAVSLGAPFWFDAARNLLAVTRPRATSRDS